MSRRTGSEAVSPLVAILRQRGVDLDHWFRGYRLSRNLPDEDIRRQAWDAYWDFMDDQGVDGILQLIDAGAKPPASGGRGMRGHAASGQREQDIKDVRKLIDEEMTFVEACNFLGFSKSRKDYLRKLMAKSGNK